MSFFLHILKIAAVCIHLRENTSKTVNKQIKMIAPTTFMFEILLATVTALLKNLINNRNTYLKNLSVENN